MNVLFLIEFTITSNHDNSYCKQFGFRSKHCTVDALIELTEKVIMRQSSSNVLCFVLDLKKAFDTINRDILLYKFERYGLRGSCLSWLKSYLESRYQRVEVNGVSST